MYLLLLNINSFTLSPKGPLIDPEDSVALTFTRDVATALDDVVWAFILLYKISIIIIIIIIIIITLVRIETNLF